MVEGSSRHGDADSLDDVQDVVEGGAVQDDSGEEEEEGVTTVVVEVVWTVTVVGGGARECVAGRGEARRRPGEE